MLDLMGMQSVIQQRLLPGIKKLNFTFNFTGTGHRTTTFQTEVTGNGENWTAIFRAPDVSVGPGESRELVLDITPGDVIESDWSSIAHFTASNTNCCEYGSRIPGIWFWPGTRKVLVVDGHGDNGNSHTGEWGCDDDILTLEEGKTANLIMRMYVHYIAACIWVAFF